MSSGVRFSVEQVKAFIGGELPHAGGFLWDRVEYFLLEDGALQPYNGYGEILPGPGIRIDFTLIP